MKCVVTGAAGFIGSALSLRLLKEGDEVIGIDNLNSYYDVQIKKDRLSRLYEFKGFKFHKIDLCDFKAIENVFKDSNPDRVAHMAAQAGVRYSLTHPEAYIHSNLNGFFNVLELSKRFKVQNFVYASSSSVYGSNENYPLSVESGADHPLSLYAATKRANELMAHSYSSLYRIPTTGLRFFTVYGPWGRPDMSFFIFTKNIVENRTIKLFNYAKHRRDFTYIDDAVEAVVRVLGTHAKPSFKFDPKQPLPDISSAPYRIYNVGRNDPVWLDEVITTLEELIGKKAIIEHAPMELGDVRETCADVSSLVSDFDYHPQTPLREGAKKFVDWYLHYFGESAAKRSASPGLKEDTLDFSPDAGL